MLDRVNPEVMSVQNVVQNALVQMAAELGKLDDTNVPAWLKFVRKMEKAMESANDIIRQRALLYLNVHGTVVTDKGTREAVVGGYKLRAIPLRTGVDPKKLEKLLRSRHLDPSDHMQVELSYKLDPVKLNRMIENGILTEKDVAAVQHDKNYRVETEEIN